VRKEFATSAKSTTSVETAEMSVDEAEKKITKLQNKREAVAARG
jgi:hypothetical protein